MKDKIITVYRPRTCADVYEPDTAVVVEEVIKTTTEEILKPNYTKELYGNPDYRRIGNVPPRKRVPRASVNKPVFNGKENKYMEIKNVDYVSVLQKHHTNPSVIWFILKCQELLNYDVGSKQQPDINVVVINPTEITGKTAAQIYNAYKVLKEDLIITRVKPHNYLVNPSFILPFTNEDYHKAADAWFKLTGEQLVK